MDRREFLKKSAALGLVGAVSGCSWRYRGTTGNPPLKEKDNGLLANLQDLENNAATLVYTRKDGPVILVRRDSNVVAYKSECPHTACELNDGEKNQPLNVKDNEIRCFLHDSYFDLDTGLRLRGPAKKGTRLPIYPVRISENKVYRMG